MGHNFALTSVNETHTPLVSGFEPNPEKSRVENMLDELHEYYAQMKQFDQMDAVDIFQTLSACSARASEMRSMMLTVSSQRATAFRTKHIDPFLEECDRQFKVQSRIIAIQEMDVKLAGGRFA